MQIDKYGIIQYYKILCVYILRIYIKHSAAHTQLSHLMRLGECINS